jgi:hypothetical protein
MSVQLSFTNSCIKEQHSFIENFQLPSEEAVAYHLVYFHGKLITEITVSTR